MTFNLIEEQWIPVRRDDGSLDRIAPWQFVELDNPVVDIAAPRPDFRGGLHEFIIGLVQATSSPETEHDWRLLFTDPLSPADLRERFRPLVPFFDLDDPRQPFMQEAGLREVKEAEEEPIHELLIESPRGKTVKDNTDFFVKRRESSAFCAACTVSALYTLQAHAPQGGRGIRTSLRGGAPLTTVLRDDSSSWRTIWLNVLPQDEWRGPEELSRRFAWVGTHSDKPRSIETEHPDAHYWAMPRRVLLRPPVGAGECTVCGAAATRRYATALTRAFGLDYEGVWTHPLTPTRKLKDSVISLATRENPTGYRNWVGLVASQKDRIRAPSPVVERYRSSRRDQIEAGRELPLWVFGFSTSQATVEGWYEGEMPVLVTEPATLPHLDAHAQALVLAAEEAAQATRWRILCALFQNPKDVKGETDVFAKPFWDSTELHFYANLREASARLERGEDVAMQRSAWLDKLERAAMTCFDLATAAARVSDAPVKRLMKARLGLTRDVRTGKPAIALGFQQPRKGRKTK